MRWEIADSDDELDIAIPTKPVKVDIASAISNKLDIRDPLADTDFDGFLTQTQQISSYYDGKYDSYQHVAAANCDSSTERFLREVAPPSSSVVPTSTAKSDEASTMGGKQTPTRKSGKKRSRTQSEQKEGCTQNQSAQSRSAKKVKTHASESESAMDSGEVIDLQALITGSDKNVGASQIQSEMINAGSPSLVSIDPRPDYTSPLDLSLSAAAIGSLEEAIIQTDHHSNQVQNGELPSARPYTPYASFFGSNMQGITTSRSSMGGYQSFNIHPGELGMGYGDINPFGRPSQVTNIDDADSAELRAVAEHFQNRITDATRGGALHEIDAGSGLYVDNIQEMQTSSVGKADIERTSHTVHVEELPKESPSYSQITDREGNITHGTSHNTVEAVQLAEDTVQTQPKRRGRKRKQIAEEEAASDGQNNADELQLDSLRTKRAVRAGTVDSVSNASEISHSTAGGKSAKKRKSKKAEIQPPEVLSKKLPSSDLGLNDKAVIGLSPERYVPRPSRRRARGEPDTEIIALDARTADLVGSNQVDLTSVQAGEDAPDELVNTGKRSKGKKGKKSKDKQVNRPSTMIPNQQEDLDRQDLNQETRQLVVEDEEVVNSEKLTLEDKTKEDIRDETMINDVDDNYEDVKSSKRHDKVTVEIPALSKPDNNQQNSPPMPEPKKRGRKRKIVAEEAVTEKNEGHDKRTILAEKDPNARYEGSKTDELSSIEANEEIETTAESKSKLSALAPTDLAEAGSVTPMPSKLAIPLKDPSSATPSWQTKTRIGLSKRYSIPSLLRKIDRNKEPPKIIERKEKLSKRQLEEREQERIAREEAEAEGREYMPQNVMRGADGMLVEWDF